MGDNYHKIYKCPLSLFCLYITILQVHEKYINYFKIILDWEATLPLRWFEVLGKIYVLFEMLLNWEVTLPVRWFSKWNRERDEVPGKGWQGDQLLSTYFLSPDLFSLRDERSHLSIWCPHEHSSSLLPFALQHLWGLYRVMSSSSRFYCLSICRPWLAFSLPFANRWNPNKNTNTLQKDLTPSVFSSEKMLEDFSEPWWTTKTSLNFIS